MPDSASLLRDEIPADAPAVDRVVAAAFERQHEADIVSAVRASPVLVLSMVALQNNAVVAHVLFSRVAIAPPCAIRACALGPVAVTPALQGSGIGTALINAALARLRPTDFELVFVLGNPRYYRRFGFELAAPHGYHYGSRDFDRAFQVRAVAAAPIAAADDAWVTYHPAFDE